MIPISIEARDLPEAWFLCLNELIDKGRIYTIDEGSYAGQQRLEFEYVTVRVKYPSARPLLPEVPPGLGFPPPVAEGYLEEYLPYLMTDRRKEGEDYTYGERICFQIEEVIRMYRQQGPGTNQACMAVEKPADIWRKDPPCLRLIDTRIYDGKLNFIVYFRSWDLWGGFPANLGALQLMKEYIAGQVGVEDGEIIAASKGLHLYDYVWDLAERRTNKKIQR